MLARLDVTHSVHVQMTFCKNALNAFTLLDVHLNDTNEATTLTNCPCIMNPDRISAHDTGNPKQTPATNPYRTLMLLGLNSNKFVPNAANTYETIFLPAHRLLQMRPCFKA